MPGMRQANGKGRLSAEVAGRAASSGGESQRGPALASIQRPGADHRDRSIGIVTLYGARIRRNGMAPSTGV